MGGCCKTVFNSFTYIRWLIATASFAFVIRIQIVLVSCKLSRFLLRLSALFLLYYATPLLIIDMFSNRICIKSCFTDSQLDLT